MSCLGSPLFKGNNSLPFDKFLSLDLHSGLWSTSNRVSSFQWRLRILLPQVWFISWSVNVIKRINFHMLNQPYTFGKKSSLICYINFLMLLDFIFYYIWQFLYLLSLTVILIFFSLHCKLSSGSAHSGHCVWADRCVERGYSGVFVLQYRCAGVTSSIISLAFLCMMIFNFLVLVDSTLIFIISLVFHSYDIIHYFSSTLTHSYFQAEVLKSNSFLTKVALATLDTY